MNENDRFKPSPNSSQSSNNDPSAKPEKDYPNFELIYVPGDRFAHLYGRAGAPTAPAQPQPAQAAAPPPKPPRPPRKRAAPAPPAPPLTPAQAHSRKCTVCQHEDREAIEQAYLHWVSLAEIAYEFDLRSRYSVRRHAIATGLEKVRCSKMSHALERIIEQAGDSKPSADAVIRAIRAYSILNKDSRWVDPPSRLIVTRESPKIESYAALVDPATPLLSESVPAEQKLERLDGADLVETAKSEPNSNRNSDAQNSL